MVFVSETNNKVSLKGVIDNLISGTLKGWVFDAEFPDQIQSFYIEVDGKVITDAIAQCYRQDLEEHGFGNGKHGFFLHLGLSYEQVAGKLIRLLDKYHQPIANTDYYVVEAENHITCQYLWQKYNQFEYSVSCSQALSETQLSLRYGEACIALMPVVLPEGESTLSVTIPLGILDGFNDTFSLELKGYPAPIWVARETDFFPKYQPDTQQSRHQLLHSFHLQSLDFLLKNNVDTNDTEKAVSAYQYLIEQNKTRCLFYDISPEVDVTVFLWLSDSFHFDDILNTIASMILAYNHCDFELIFVIDPLKKNDLSNLMSTHKITYQLFEVDNIHTYGELFSQLGRLAKGKYSVVVNRPISVTSLWLDELIAPFEENIHAPDITTAKNISLQREALQPATFVDVNGQYWDTTQRVHAYHPRVCYNKKETRIDSVAWCIKTSFFASCQTSEDEIFVFSPLMVRHFSYIRKMGLNIVYAPLSEVVALTELPCSKSTMALSPKSKKKSVLLIDHAAPSVNQDAGSYAAIQEIKLIQSLGFDVVFIDLKSQYQGHKTRNLQKLGVEVLYAPFYPTVDAAINAYGAFVSAFYITRYGIAEKVLPIIKRVNAKAPILFNNADLHFLRELRVAINENDPEKIYLSTVTRDRELAVMRAVNAVLSYTETEKAVITSHLLVSDKIHRCPWVLENKKIGLPFEQREGIAFLGGYSHTPNLEAVYFFVEHVAPLLLEKSPEITFYIYGSNMPESFTRFSAENVKAVGFVENLDDLYHHHRIFVAPLLSGAGIKGKVLESIAYGLPTVLSSVASEGIGLSHNITTLNAETAEQWCEEILRLYNDSQLWSRISENQRILAQTQFSFSRGKIKMEQIFKAVGLTVGDSGVND